MYSRDTNAGPPANSYACADTDSRNNTRAPIPDAHPASATDSNPNTRLYPAAARHGQLVAG